MLSKYPAFSTAMVQQGQQCNREYEDWGGVWGNNAQVYHGPMSFIIMLIPSYYLTSIQLYLCANC